MLDASPVNVISFLLPGCYIDIGTTFDILKKIQNLVVTGIDREISHFFMIHTFFLQFL